MDTVLPQKFPFILDRNLAKANCIENLVCTSCDTVTLGFESNLDWIRAVDCTGKVSSKAVKAFFFFFFFF